MVKKRTIANHFASTAANSAEQSSPYRPAKIRQTVWCMGGLF